MPGDLIKTLSKAKEQLMKMPAYGRPPVFYPPDGCCDNPTVPRELGLCSVCNERSVIPNERT